MKSKMLAFVVLTITLAACGGAEVASDEPTTTLQATTTTTERETTTTELDGWESSEDKDFYTALATSGEFPELPGASYVPGVYRADDEVFYRVRDSIKDSITTADEMVALDGSCQSVSSATRGVILSESRWSSRQLTILLNSANEAYYRMDSPFMAAFARCL